MRFWKQKMTPEEKAATDKETWTAWFVRYIARLKLEGEGVEDVRTASESRTTTMNQHNPRYESIRKKHCTMGPAYNEFGYYEHPAITSNFFLRKEHF